MDRQEMYVDLEIAKGLKALGYNEPLYTFIEDDGESYTAMECVHAPKGKLESNEYLQPTLDSANTWLYMYYNVFVEIRPARTGRINYTVCKINDDGKELIGHDRTCGYFDALNKGIKKALEYLIGRQKSTSE